ncbi:nitrite reductase large subunit NirB [Robertmurraya sp. P23]|uniref:nitrite reductase large subunit NirB n=1 Tax=Robertmurraya sp. P23 TaxID=3436931 RepID=UPI003D98B52F
MKKQKLVMVGNGMAGVRCLEEILKTDSEMFEITVVGSEPHPNYNRILLSSVLQGSTKLEEITINDFKWYEQHQIQLFTGETVVAIDHKSQIVMTDKGRNLYYDRLILATGSVPFVLPLPGVEKEGVISFRTIEDCQKMQETAKNHKKAVVIGGGLLGLEAARGLLHLGMEVHVVHISSFLMERQLDETAAKMLQAELEKQGMKFLLEKQTEEILGNKRIEGLRFTDGTSVEADLLVMAVGVRPNVHLAKESGLTVNRAIVVNDFLETSIPNIFAVGECVEHRGMVYGLVKPLYEQAVVLAKRICGVDGQGYEGTVLATQLKISGVDVFSIGTFQEDSASKSIKIQDEVEGTYKRLVFQEDKIIGAVLFGDTSDRTKLQNMILKKQDVSDIEKVTIFQSSGSGTAVTSMAATEIICNCNGVSKGTIIEAVQIHGCSTVDDVKACTKASGSCGGCKPLVSELLSYIHSDEFDEIKIEKPTMCNCTSLTEDEVVHEMQVQNLSSVNEVMQALNWKHKEGCSKCVPALTYYLSMINPEYENVQETLFVNEKMNATLQKDGTYFVVPQMYGGMTNPHELRKIANVADKYGVSELAITSEQRIHLMGLTKEELPKVWNDLNMPLSATYGNRVQNVKTCIGEHICQCDKQKALQLSASLEKKLEYLITPYRVKIGVSACLHNGAGSTTKDIGIIGTKRGWEIYVGGSSGRSVKAGQLFTVAETEEEAVSFIGGLVQYYRETANYSERTWEWVDRVSLLHVREVLFDFELRQQLLERLEGDCLMMKGSKDVPIF